MSLSHNISQLPVIPMQNETRKKEIASELLSPMKKYRDLMVFAP